MLKLATTILGLAAGAITTQKCDAQFIEKEQVSTVWKENNCFNAITRDEGEIGRMVTIQDTTHPSYVLTFYKQTHTLSYLNNYLKEHNSAQLGGVYLFSLVTSDNAVFNSREEYDSAVIGYKSYGVRAIDLKYIENSYPGIGTAIQYFTAGILEPEFKERAGYRFDALREDEAPRYHIGHTSQNGQYMINGHYHGTFMLTDDKVDQIQTIETTVFPSSKAPNISLNMQMKIEASWKNPMDYSEIGFLPQTYSLTSVDTTPAVELQATKEEISH